jgi:hypothetical protein
MSLIRVHLAIDFQTICVLEQAVQKNSTKTTPSRRESEAALNGQRMLSSASEPARSL